MSLSTRLSLAIGAVGAVTLTATAALTFVVASVEIRSTYDDELLARAELLTNLPSDVPADLQPTGVDAPVPDAFFADDLGLELAVPDGPVVALGLRAPLPALTEPVAEGLSTEQTDEGTYRILVARVPNLPVDQPDADRLVRSGGVRVGEAAVDELTVRLFRDVTPQEAALRRLAATLLLTATMGTVLVAVGGWVLGRRLARPLREVAAAADHLADLDDLPGRIEVDRADEAGRVATAFNRVLSALEVAREQQRRMVADASHDLRTPLTALRARLEFLDGTPDLAEETRRQQVTAAVDDVLTLAARVEDLVDLAVDVGAARDEEPVATDLRELLDEVASRVRVSSGREVVVDSDGAVVLARPVQVRRAVRNLVDNAVKYAPDGPVTLRSLGTAIEVVDHGPGVAEDDAAHVFDRFYRSPRARTRPGNGIGLAIVRQVADVHGGRTWVRETPGGGATIGLALAPAD